MTATDSKKIFIFNSAKDYLPWAAIIGIVALTIFQLHNQGRIWWCKLGDYAPWASEAWGTHTSQHLFDPYVFTHILHGVGFFWIISLIFRKTAFSRQLALAVLLECAWEILENSTFIIEKYRENTASLDYFGDSVANSIGDIIACAFGFGLAFKLGFWRSLAFFLIVEIILLIWIRDSLLLNIIMLLYPFEGLKNWQMEM